MKQKLAVTVRFQVEVDTAKIVKVKSHKRGVNGKNSQGAFSLSCYWGIMQ